MQIHKPIDGQPPRRKSKPKQNVLDRDQAFLNLKALISNAKFKPQEAYGLYVNPEDGKRLGLKNPSRTIAESLRRFIKDNGLERDYTVVQYETRTPGQWFVQVSYEPPLLAATAKRG